MTFDESDCSHVIICDRQGAGLKLWKLLDGEWTKIWEGVPEIPLYFYYFGGAISCYYDKNLGSLIILGYCYGPAPETCYPFLLRYVPGAGLVFHEWLPLCPLWASAVYDPYKKRELLIGGFFYGMGDVVSATVEYDGNEFYIVPYPEGSPEIAFVYGSAGFDPETGDAVFYGERYDDVDNTKDETWEFDGSSWALVPTDSAPQMTGYDPLGMIYVPALQGLLAMANNEGPMYTWIYRDKQWHQVEVDNQFIDLPGAFLIYDAERNAPVFYGGWTETGFSNRMFELQCSSHIRPIYKP